MGEPAGPDSHRFAFPQVELKTGETYRGTLVEAEDNWNSQMKDITVTGRVRRVASALAGLSSTLGFRHARPRWSCLCKRCTHRVLVSALWVDPLSALRARNTRRHGVAPC